MRGEETRTVVSVCLPLEPVFGSVGQNVEVPSDPSTPRDKDTRMSVPDESRLLQSPFAAGHVAKRGESEVVSPARQGALRNAKRVQASISLDAQLFPLETKVSLPEFPQSSKVPPQASTSISTSAAVASTSPTYEVEDAFSMGQLARV